MLTVSTDSAWAPMQRVQAFVAYLHHMQSGG